jgi:hypothetical protein
VHRIGPLPERTALPVVLQMARGLRQAAFHGALHGDLSPRVVRIEPTGRVQVEDAGVGALNPRTDRPVRAPAYASPERRRGAASADVRSDVYSLGAILFFVLTGAAPGGRRRGGDARRPASAEANDPLGLGPDVAPDVARLVARMMAGDPSRRHATWDEVLLDLERAAPAESAPAHAAAARERVAGLMIARPAVFAGLALVIVVAGSVSLRVLMSDGPPARERFDSAMIQADALVRRGDVESARILIGRFVKDVGDPAVENEAARRLEELKGK